MCLNQMTLRAAMQNSCQIGTLDWDRTGISIPGNLLQCFDILVSTKILFIFIYKCGKYLLLNWINFLPIFVASFMALNTPCLSVQTETFWFTAGRSVGVCALDSCKLSPEIKSVILKEMYYFFRIILSLSFKNSDFCCGNCSLLWSSL